MQRTFFSTASLPESSGFLPSYRPAASLPENNDYQAALNRMIKDLPTLLANKTLRQTVNELAMRFPNPTLVLDKGNKAQKATALLFLSAIVHAYVFEDHSSPIRQVPAVIAKPFYALCRSKQRFAIMSYTDYVLHNWTLRDANMPVSLDNIDPIVTFTNTKDEAWFIKIHVAIEAAAAKAIDALQQAYRESQSESFNKVSLTENLSNISTSLTEVIDIMHHMKDNLDADVFWNTLRPYLGGFEKTKPEGSNDPGVYFEGLIELKDKKPFAYSGPSGAQSSIVPALDAGLRIKHDIDGMFSYLLKFKEYMPTEHQAFILHMSSSRIKHAVKQADDKALTEAYNTAVQSVKTLRGAHLGLVHQFIYKPAEAQGIPHDAITGTGGSPIDSYLGGRYAHTRGLTS